MSKWSIHKKEERGIPVLIPALIFGRLFYDLKPRQCVRKPKELEPYVCLLIVMEAGIQKAGC